MVLEFLKNLIKIQAIESLKFIFHFILKGQFLDCFLLLYYFIPLVQLYSFNYFIHLIFFQFNFLVLFLTYFILNLEYLLVFLVVIIFLNFQFFHFFILH